MSDDLLRQYLSFYRDLGVKTVNRREVPEPASIEPVEQSGVSPTTELPLPLLPLLHPTDDTLAGIREDIGDCKRCRLGDGRKKIVFGSGNGQARLVFVGEGPGADEDEQGLPFVGRAGQLLTQMIEGTAHREGIPLSRPDVYICNVVKCRPPGNRDPAPAEVEACRHYLEAQVAAVAPRVIVTLGNFAARTLLDTTDTVTRLRGRSYPYGTTVIVPTFHPSYALRGSAAIVAEMRADLVRAKRFLLVTS
jgi:DNA polymerase